MAKKSTRLKIVFFSLLLVGFIVIQYNWVQSLQKDKQQELSSRIISGIEDAGENMLYRRSLYKLTDSTIANMLGESLSTYGLGNIRFEFSISSSGNHFASHGFNQKLIDNSSNLIFNYAFQGNGEKRTSDDVLTVVVPFWKKYTFKEMAWIIAASLLLTIMILVIFCCTFIWGERRQQLFYDNRTNVIKNMMKQLETPLSTMSVAAEALRNDKVMHDSRKTSYYQQIINEEGQRMNEQVKKMLRDLE